MKEGRSSIVEHQESSVQEETYKETDRKICGALCDRGSNIVKCSKVMVAKFDENPSGGERKPDSVL